MQWCRHVIGRHVKDHNAMENYPCLDGFDCVNGLAALAIINDPDDGVDAVLVEN